MQSLRSPRLISSLVVLAGLLCAAGSTARAQAQSSATAGEKSHACPNDDTGLKLPSGFCATVFADDIGHARHLVAAPSGIVYVNTWSGRYYGNKPPHPGGFLVALQDNTGSGKADVIERFGDTPENGGAGGTGIGLYDGRIYAEINDRIVRYSLPAGAIVPNGAAETVVSGLPLGGDHPMHPFIIDGSGSMFVDVGTATNACQVKNRTLESPGRNPCTELETRGGIWRYDAKQTGQEFSPQQRYATGIRNGEGFLFDSSGRLFVTQHGRDQLHQNWPKIYKPEEEATLPSEELLLLQNGGDYGWPECYYDPFVQRLVLAPEYGGDGNKAGECAQKTEPVAVFPAHWAPNDATHYDKDQFPERYRNGVFIAFHGSWDRAPYAQSGYNVVFQPMANGKADGPCEIFAQGFAGPGTIKSRAEAEHRPSGLAVGPDGSLYVSDDIRGRIYKIVYRGGVNTDAQITPCPSLTAPAGPVVSTEEKPPEGTHPNAGAAAASNLPIPPGATQQTVALGDRIFHGEVAGAACTGCHGDNGQGTPVGPPLAGPNKKWLWSDGSYAGIQKTITDGVPQPKDYRSPMPPMGGAQLTPEQVSAVAAYVWSISHRSQ